MRFDASRALLSATPVDPDPATSPGLVTDAAILQLRTRQPETDVPGRRILLGLDSANAPDTVTVELWALDEQTLGGDPADRRFYLFGAATPVAAGALVEVATAVPNIGASANPVFARLTVVSVTTSAILRAACTA